MGVPTTCGSGKKYKQCCGKYLVLYTSVPEI